jgi:hypothetical protein
VKKGGELHVGVNVNVLVAPVLLLLFVIVNPVLPPLAPPARVCDAFCRETMTSCAGVVKIVVVAVGLEEPSVAFIW